MFAHSCKIMVSRANAIKLVLMSWYCTFKYEIEYLRMAGTSVIVQYFRQGKSWSVAKNDDESY